MTQTNILDTSRTECNNGECIRITSTCIDGDCNEVRVVIPESELEPEPPSEPRRARQARRAGGHRNDQGPDSVDDEGDDESDDEGDDESDRGLCDVKDISFAIIFNGGDISLFFGIMCLIMLIVFAVGLIRIKNKK